MRVARTNHPYALRLRTTVHPDYGPIVRPGDIILIVSTHLNDGREDNLVIAPDGFGLLFSDCVRSME